MDLSKFESLLTGHLRKLAGVMPVGHPWWGVDPLSKPAGVQLYAGQLLSRSAYPVHWEFVSGGKRTVLSEDDWQSMVEAQGFCPFYSSGDGSATYRMPMVKGVHPKFVAAWAEAGQYVEAGLPNITGTFATEGRLGNSAPTGAFYLTGKTTEGAPGAGTDHILGLDASRSSPVYGNSDSVQPPAVTMVVGEYVVGSVATIGEADAESLLASVTHLESEALGRSTVKAYIIETWGSDDSGYRKWSDGRIEQWGVAKTGTTSAGTVVTLLAEMRSSDYRASADIISNFPMVNSVTVWTKIGGNTTTTFNLGTGFTGPSESAYASYTCKWAVDGYYKR